MIGALTTALFCIVAVVPVLAWIRKKLDWLDPAELVGVCGLGVLGLCGLLVFAIGLLPSGLDYVLQVVCATAIAGVVLAWKTRGQTALKFQLPDFAGRLVLAGLVAVGLIALCGVLAPSVTTDWDTIAYHLAVPKMWIEKGQIEFVRGMHQSNFPFTVECLFLLGLKWGGQAGAKAFSLAYFVFGCVGVFGIARRWSGPNAAWWSALAFAGIPIVAWESGTGYIDVAHGLYAAFGIVYAIEALSLEPKKGGVLLAGAMLGLALGTKYTGLQILFALFFVVLAAAILDKSIKRVVRPALLIVGLAVVVACPWYVRTYVNTGNPVFPFFASVFETRDWDAWRSSVYQNEQRSFGVGKEPERLGHAILGLAYQPGRYTNPGQDSGRGFPTGAVGFAVVLVGVSAALATRRDKRQALVLATVGVGLAMWFVLSQQSRYLTVYMVPLAMLAGGQVVHAPWRKAVAAAIAVQCLVTFAMLASFQTKDQIPVVTGAVTQDEYLTKRMPVYRANKVISQLPKDSYVALYDEVFGFYLDRKYFWANPGHSKLIPYEDAPDGASLVSALRKIGFTHVYVNLATGDARFIEAMGMTGAFKPYTLEERAEMTPDLDRKWKVLLADALSTGHLQPVQTFGTSVLFALPPTPIGS